MFLCFSPLELSSNQTFMSMSTTLIITKPITCISSLDVVDVGDYYCTSTV